MVSNAEYVKPTMKQSLALFMSVIIYDYLWLLQKE